MIRYWAGSWKLGSDCHSCLNSLNCQLSFLLFSWMAIYSRIDHTILSPPYGSLGPQLRLLCFFITLFPRYIVLWYIWSQIDFKLIHTLLICLSPSFIALYLKRRHFIRKLWPKWGSLCCIRLIKAFPGWNESSNEQTWCCEIRIHYRYWKSKPNGC